MLIAAKSSAVSVTADAAEAFQTAFGAQFQTGEAIRRQHGSSETHFAEILPEAVIFAQSTADVARAVDGGGAVGAEHAGHRVGVAGERRRAARSL